MNIEVADYKYNPSKRRFANVIVKYGELFIECDLVYYAKGHKLWLRMPEIWLSKDFKHRYVFWEKNESSVQFQEQVIKKLFEKHDVTVDKVADTLRPKKINKLKNRNL